MRAISERPIAQQPGGVRNFYPALDQLRLWGRDLFVIEAVTGLLVWAPLSADQRAALFSLLADIPAWYQPGASDAVLRIRDLGPVRDALGRTRS